MIYNDGEVRDMTATAPNVVLITIDNLRIDHMSCYGYNKKTTPNIDKLASRGTLFEQLISNGGNTPCALPSIIASALPPLHYSEYKTIIKRNTSIAEVLKRNGYKTASFHCIPLISRPFHYHKGFDTFVNRMTRFDFIKERQLSGALENSESMFYSKLATLVELLIMSGLLLVRAEKVTDKALNWLRNYTPRKTFLWLHYMDCHRPLLPPSEYRSQFCPQIPSHYGMLKLDRKIMRNRDKLTESDLKSVIGLYDATIRYIDNTIGLFLSELGDISNTIIIVTSDHGDQFGEHEKFGHGTLYEEVIRVPLIIAGPGISERVVVKNQVSSLDIAPTIVDLLNHDPVDKFCGQSLLPAMRGHQQRSSDTISVLLEYTLKQKRIITYRTEQWKYIRTDNFNNGKLIQKELYDLINDPKERNDLHREEKERSQIFESKIQSYITQAKLEGRIKF